MLDDSFNFYDVYGYFLPGMVLVALLWLPFGAIYGRWPAGEAIYTLLAIPLAYVVGHVVQIFGTRALPSTAGSGRFPSDLVVDEANTIFSSDFKVKLAVKIKETFGLDVYGDPATVSGRRRDALFLCRSALIKAKTASYSEQLEGMYSLTRGLAVSFLLGAAYTAGASLQFIASARRWALPCLLGALFIALAIEFWQPPPPEEPVRWKAVASLAAVALALVCAGYGMAQDQTISPNLRYFLAASVLVAVLLSRKFYYSYRYFTWEFAKAVYRDFATYEKPHTEEKAKPE